MSEREWKTRPEPACNTRETMREIAPGLTIYKGFRVVNELKTRCPECGSHDHVRVGEDKIVETNGTVTLRRRFCRGCGKTFMEKAIP